MSARSEAELLAAWRAGDQAAGSELFEQHFDSLFRFFRNKVDSAAEDLVQQTFLSCLASSAEFRGEASFRTYLFTIARNKLHDHLRGFARREQPVDFGAVSLADLGTSPSRHLLRNEEEALVQAALARLPLDLQVAIELVYVEGMSAPEVAAVLGVPEGTVRSRIRRALETLREEVAGLGAPAQNASRRIEHLQAETVRRIGPDPREDES